MSNKSLNYLNLNKNNLPYNISIITDTLFYSILKVVVKGNIRDPVPLVDVNSLIGTTIQSALMQFGGGYPLLEDIHCVSSVNNKFLNQKGCTCSQLGNNNWCKYCENYNVPKLGNTNIDRNLFPNINQNMTKSKSDGNYESDTNKYILNENDINSVNNIPITYNPTNNNANLSYALISVNNLQDLITKLNKTNKKINKLGKWIHECNCDFRYYYNGIKVSELNTVNNLSINTLLSELSKIDINGENGKWNKDGIFNYKFNTYNKISLYLDIVKTDNLDLLQVLNHLDLENERGKWVIDENDSMSYLLKTKLQTIDALITYDKLQQELHLMEWHLISLNNGVSKYKKGDKTVNLMQNNSSVSITGDPLDITTIINDILTPNIISFVVVSKWSTYPRELIVIDNEKDIRIMGDEVILNKIANSLNIDSNTIIKEFIGKIICICDLISLNNKVIQNKWKINKNENIYILTKNDKVLELNEVNNVIKISGDLRSIKHFINGVLEPNNIGYEKVFNPVKDNSFQLFKLENNIKLIGNEKLINSIYEKIPYLFSKPSKSNFKVLHLKTKLGVFLKYLKPNWKILDESDREVLLVNKQNKDLFIEIMSNGENITIWGNHQTIERLQYYIKDDRKYKVEENISTPIRATIFNISEHISNLSDSNNTYQIISDNLTIEELSKNIDNPHNCIIKTNLNYISLTVNVNIERLSEALVNYDYGIGTLGWRKDETKHVGVSDNNMFRFYKLENGGIERSTQYFIYLFSSSNGDGKPYSKVEGDEYVINNFIKPVNNFYNWNTITAGKNLVKPTPITVNVGKVTGLTGNIRKLPDCNAHYSLVIF